MPHSKCLIIDQMHPSIVDLLDQNNFDADYQPKTTREEILEIVPAYQGLIVRSKTPIDKELIDRATSLRFVARAGAGLDNIDTDYLRLKKIAVISAPEGNRDALAEHAVGLLLNLSHRIGSGHDQVRQGIWDREGNRGVEVMGKTVGLIGYGFMGKAFAQRLKSFGCEVLAYDKYKEGFSDQFVTEATLETLWEQAQIISLHVPLTPETLGFYDFRFFSNFKHNLLVLNTARGEILPLKDLVRLMDSSKITGVALDVLSKEPISKLADNQQDVHNYLVNSSRVLLTPHIGGWSHESYERINQVLVSKIKQLGFDKSIT
ncbi:MAG: NAD(P)-dependent oxidoreductase [Cyclobacteriaceae bacterium]